MSDLKVKATDFENIYVKVFGYCLDVKRYLGELCASVLRQLVFLKCLIIDTHKNVLPSLEAWNIDVCR